MRADAAPAIARPAPSGAATRRGADLWWLQPSAIVLLVIAPVYLAIMSYDFAGVVQNVYVPGPLYGFGLVLILAIAVGAQWALSVRREGPVLTPPLVSKTAMMVLLVPTLCAYALWFGPLLGQPQLLWEVATGLRREIRDSVSTVPGVTTFTQFGVAYAIAFGIKCGAGMQRVDKVERLGFALIVMLAVFRGFAWAERLAVIEVLVCYAVARLAYLPIASARSWRLAATAPAIAPFLLYLVFTASECVRSWEFYSKQYSSVWAFTLERLITYYATAVNNGIGMLVETPDWPLYSGAFSLDWAYLMPGLGRLLESSFGSPQGLYKDFLEIYARPEFNSPTAYFRVMLDWGYLGSIVYFVLGGYLIGRAYAGFRRGHLFGLLGYPVFVLFLIESLRYSYFAESRVVPALGGLILVGLDMRESRRHQAFRQAPT
ncbi:Oligosaccharide repeat unit polymerase OS=Rhizobacter sp. Root404 OX=1736528 GN=ASC76_01565 PE=4 SV=1 [Rhizobacter fulvus]